MERLPRGHRRRKVTHEFCGGGSFESYGDDAVAIGLTDQQPGFVLLSHLPASRVMVDAQVRSNWITGTQTILNIRTPSSRVRLRLPQTLLVSGDGAIVATAVPWTRPDFDALIHAADCETHCDKHVHRCGQPLDDLAHAVAQWPPQRVPAPVRDFLARHIQSNSP